MFFRSYCRVKKINQSIRSRLRGSQPFSQKGLKSSWKSCDKIIKSNIFKIVFSESFKSRGGRFLTQASTCCFVFLHYLTEEIHNNNEQNEAHTALFWEEDRLNLLLFFSFFVFVWIWLGRSWLWYCGLIVDWLGLVP